MKIYLRAAIRTATVITRTDGKALIPELVGVVTSGFDVDEVGESDAAAWEELEVAEPVAGAAGEEVARLGVEATVIAVLALQ